MVQTSMWVDEFKEPKAYYRPIEKTIKHERPLIPLPKKTEKIKEDRNIKNYL